MKALLVARRDLSSFLGGWYGWIIIAALLLVFGAFYQGFVLGGSPQPSNTVLQTYLQWLSVFTGVAAWLLSMRSIAEEKQTRTELVLQTSPISDAEVVVGKWLAVAGMVSLFLLLTAHMPALIVVHGKVSFAHVAVGYLGCWLYGMAVGAIGLFGSALVRTQVAAAVLSGALVVGLVVFWFLATIADPPLNELASYIALWNKHMQPFTRGALSLDHTVYYLSVTWLFLVLATRSLERRRWE